MMPAPVTRFAPSPTGLLHLGHAFSARMGWQAAHDEGGTFLLRIDDLDQTRARPEYESAILEDLAWLGLAWSPPLRRQSERLAEYRAAVESLKAAGLVYPCFCTRKEIQAELAAMGGAPQGGEGAIYPGTCRRLTAAERARKLAEGALHALRLDVSRAEAVTGPLYWEDLQAGRVRADPSKLGDVVIARKDAEIAYHLAVVVDDAAQGVTRITRGRDLFDATHIHRLLQALLGLPPPVWDHHRLIVDESGARLAKRADSLSIRALREAGLSPAALWSRLGLPPVRERPVRGRQTPRNPCASST